MSNGLSLGDDDLELRKALAARRPGDDDFELPQRSRRDLRSERDERDHQAALDEAQAQQDRREAEEEDLHQRLAEVEREAQAEERERQAHQEEEVDGAEASRELGGSGEGSGHQSSDVASATDSAITAQNDGDEDEDEPEEIASETEPEPQAPRAEPAAVVEDPSPSHPQDVDEAVDDPHEERAPREPGSRARQQAEAITGEVPSDVMDTLVGRGIDMDSEHRSQLRLPRTLVTALRSMAMVGLQRLYAARGQSLDQIPQFNQNDTVLSFMIAQLGASFSGASDVQQDLIEVFSAGNPGLDAVDRRLADMQQGQDQMSEDIEIIGRMSRANEEMSARLEVALAYLLADAVGDVDVSNVTVDSMKLTQNPALVARKQLHRQTSMLTKVEKTQKGRPIR